MNALMPDEVVRRLAENGSGLDGLVSERGGRTVESRAFTRPEIRRADDGESLLLVGYATVWDYPYDVAGGAERGGWSETIAAGAATKSLLERDDVRLLLNHDGIPLARTKSGTLKLTADDIGLLVEASLDPSSSLVSSIRSALERSDMDEMSFAFRVIKQVWSGDYAERIITEVALHDVSIVTFPANPATLVKLRSDVDSSPTVTGIDLRTAKAVRDSLSLSRN